MPRRAAVPRCIGAASPAPALGSTPVSFGANASKRVGLLLGDARDAVFLAQQVHDLLVEDLPGEQARLLHHLMAVFGIGVAVKVEPLVEEALAARIHQDAEWIVVLLEAVADREVAIGRRIHVPLHGMRARPMARTAAPMSIAMRWPAGVELVPRTLARSQFGPR